MDFAQELRAREAKRRAITSEISLLLLAIPVTELPEVRNQMNAVIHKETSSLEEAKKETERLYRPALHRPHANVI